MIGGISPSDAVSHQAWPLWRKLLAYLLMFALASVSIWEIDRLAMRQAQNFTPPPAAAQPSN